MLRNADLCAVGHLVNIAPLQFGEELALIHLDWSEVTAFSKAGIAYRVDVGESLLTMRGK